MSTKINVRSPFYLSYAEPTVPSPTFSCDIAEPRSISDGTLNQFDVNQQGVITKPKLAFGTIMSISSSDSGFSNDKYSTVTTDTPRTITLEIAIPTGFSNSSDGTFNCDVTAVQPPYQPSAVPPSGQPAQTCVNGPTATGSIGTQTLASGSGSSTIDLSSYFNQGTVAITGYNIFNNYNILNISFQFNNNCKHSGTDHSISVTRQESSGTYRVYYQKVE